jgi:hypothetical protein
LEHRMLRVRGMVLCDRVRRGGLRHSQRLRRRRLRRHPMRVLLRLQCLQLMRRRLKRMGRRLLLRLLLVILLRLLLVILLLLRRRVQQLLLLRRLVERLVLRLVLRLVPVHRHAQGVRCLRGQSRVGQRRRWLLLVLLLLLTRVRVGGPGSVGRGSTVRALARRTRCCGQCAGLKAEGKGDI